MIWRNEWIEALRCDFDLVSIYFQEYMHGGSRDRWSTVLTHAPWLSILKATCDKNHQHAPFGISKQKRNSEYPAVLCNTIASAAHASALQHGAQANLAKPQAMKRKAVAPTRSQAGRQTHGNRHPELLPELEHVVGLPWLAHRPTKWPRMLISDELGKARVRAS